MPDREVAPRAEYRRRADRHRERAAEAGRLEESISRARLGVVLAAVLMAWLVFGPVRVSPWWLVVPAAAFAALLVVHARIRRRRRRAERGVAFYERGLARLEGQWAGAGRTGARFLDPHHPYADDLDIFGEGSLYELLCGARTLMGEETLAAWLLAPADLPSVRARQAALQELSPHLDLREDLAALGEEVAATVRPDALVALTTSAGRAAGTRLRLAGVAVSAVTLGAVASWSAGWAPPTVTLGALALQGLVHWRLRERVRDAERAVAGHGPDLELLATVLERFEREPLTSPLLVELRDDLTSAGRRPSQAVRRLRLLVDLFDSRRNQFFAPVALLTMWDVHGALAIEAWRARHGASVTAWLTAVGQLEALCSLAGFAWEHPADVYPGLDEGEARFDAEGLGHPLMPEARCVRNDVALGGAIRVLIVSGSNMSGKSTLLRAVGVNAVLALAGAPVRATRLRLSRVRVGATLRIRDSLQEGTSRFYAELVRLRDLVRIADGPIPLLFLLDEILHGTNSHDRRLGAAAVVSGLVQRGAIGLVTTHDLALSEVANDPGVRAANVHFEDRLEDGQMVFDYRMRPGVVQTSNALALMRTLGLWPDAPSR
jgi:MutS domain V